MNSFAVLAFLLFLLREFSIFPYYYRYNTRPCNSYFFFLFFFFAHFNFSASGQAVVTGVIPPPRFLPSICIAHRIQQSHCTSIAYRVLLTHAVALSASQFVHKRKPQRIYTSMHSAGLELTKLTYIRLKGDLIRHRGDRCTSVLPGAGVLLYLLSDSIKTSQHI